VSAEGRELPAHIDGKFRVPFWALLVFEWVIAAAG